MNFTVGLVSLVKLLVKVIPHRIFFGFFIHSFFIAILSVYTDEMFLSVFTEGYSDGEVHR